MRAEVRTIVVQASTEGNQDHIIKGKQGLTVQLLTAAVAIRPTGYNLFVTSASPSFPSSLLPPSPPPRLWLCSALGRPGTLAKKTTACSGKNGEREPVPRAG